MPQTNNVTRAPRRQFLLCLLFICVGSSVGCVSSRVSNLDIPRLDLSHNVQYNDLPVPFGFEFDDKESWAYRTFEKAAMPFRSCELVYWGDQPTRHLANWYESQMPGHQWAHIETNEDSKIVLVFSKGVERSEIELKRTIDREGREPITKVTCRILAN